MKIDILVKFCTLFSFQLWFQRDTPHLHIKSTLYVCRRVQGSQIFKQNWIISIHSKVIAFLVILLSPHGLHIPVVPMLSPHCPHIVSTWSPHPCGPHIVSTLSPRCPHIITVIPISSYHWHCPHHPHIISTPTYPLHPPPPPRGGPQNQ